MMVDHELIAKAKEKLGDKNAEIIADLLHIGDYDPEKRRGLCPFHAEDTPSFIYNPKSYSFHCFGCNVNADIIDAYMKSGHTYIGALQKLFEMTKIKYSFGEQGVKTRQEYRYPHDEPDADKSAVYSYLGKRGISQKTIDDAGIRQDAQGNIVFRYFDTNDTLTMVKYRPARKVTHGENKMWCQKDADTSPLLFNMNRINTECPLVITEGEIDALSAIEAGWANAVSVPLGAKNTHWIENNWEWLQQFNSIILCGDNDEPGQQMIKDISYRLGSWRTKIVDLPTTYTKPDGKTVAIKDLNEVLFWYGKKKALDVIVHAKDSPVESVVDFTDIKEVDLDEIDGIYTGIKQFDVEMLRLFYGTFNIVTGVNGSGKSSFLSQLVCQCLEQGRDAWLYSKELPNYMSKNWINYIFAGARNVDSFTNARGSVYYKVKPEIKEKIDSFYKGRLYIYKDGWPNTIDDIEQSMEDSARKFGCKLFIIDNLTAINLHAAGDDKWEKQVDFVNYLIDFAKKYNVVVVLVIHPKKIETMRRLQKFDVAGLGSIVDLAHRLISLYRVTPKDKEGEKKSRGVGYYKQPIKYDVLIDVLKDRLRGRENLSIGLYYDKASRRFYSNPEEYDFQYAWDKSTYKEPIPYPHADDDDPEVFGSVKSNE